MLLAQAFMPLSYWWEAFLTTTFLINGLPTPILNGKSLIELLLHKQLNVSDLWIFGVPVTHIFDPYNNQKFNFANHALSTWAPVLFTRVTNVLVPSDKVFISRHVNFNEPGFLFVSGVGDSNTDVDNFASGIPATSVIKYYFLSFRYTYLSTFSGPNSESQSYRYIPYCTYQYLSFHLLAL